MDTTQRAGDQACGFSVETKLMIQAPGRVMTREGRILQLLMLRKSERRKRLFPSLAAHFWSTDPPFLRKLRTPTAGEDAGPQVSGSTSDFPETCMKYKFPRLIKPTMLISTASKGKGS